MKYFKKLEGKKIYLSPVHEDDIEKYVYWMNNRDVTDNLGNTVFLNTLTSEKEWFLNLGKNGNVTFAIVKKEDDELIGNCSLMHIDRINRKCTLGIFIGDDKNRNKGYGQEVLTMLVNYAFNFQNMHSIDLKVFSFNEPAIKCYEKVGFKKCGIRHEAYYLDGNYYDEVTMEILKKYYMQEK